MHITNFDALGVLDGLSRGVDTGLLFVELEHDNGGRVLRVGRVPSVSSVIAKCADVRLASPKH